MIADDALLILSVIIFFNSIVLLYGTAVSNHYILLFSFYSHCIYMIYISVFAIGAITFNHTMTSWVEVHWEEIRPYAYEYSLVEFQSYISGQLITLGGLSIAQDACLAICFVCITFLFGFKSIMEILYPLFNMQFVIFGMSFILMRSYAVQNAAFTALPIWSENALLITGILIIGISVYGALIEKYKLRNGYRYYRILLVGISIVLIFISTGMIYASNAAGSILGGRWDEIKSKLSIVDEEIMVDMIESMIGIHLKLSSLYLSIFQTFILLSIVSTIKINC